MLISTIWRALIDAGVELVPVDAWSVELRHGDRSARMPLHASARPLKPGEVAAVIDSHRQPGLLVVPAATIQVRYAVERAGWSWLVAGPPGVHGVLQFGGETVRVGEDDADRDRSVPGKPGRVPWGTLTLIRCLLERPATTQRSLAACARVSQPRASQILADLVRRQFIERDRSGWTVRDFDGLLRHWLDIYPGPGGIGTYWYGLAPVGEQARTAMRLLTGPRATGAPPAALSGDLAADIIAPWRSPVRAVIYAPAGADLAAAELVPATQEEATLELIVPEDPGLWPLPVPPASAAPKVNQVGPVADPLQILWDVQRSPGPDSHEAAGRLWEMLRDRFRRLPQASS